MTRAGPPALLVFAIGNPSRGDDALGPALLDALLDALPDALPDALCDAGKGADGDVELLVDFQLQVEHALDLQGRHAVLFVDAARPGWAGHAGNEAGVALTPLEPAASLPVLSHALPPSALLLVSDRLGLARPPAWLLTIEGRQFELGEPISQPAQARLAVATALARRWIDHQREIRSAIDGAGCARFTASRAATRRPARANPGA